MPVKYSLALRKNPMNKEAAPKVYATAQASGNLSLDELCEHIAQHGSIWTPDVVNGVVRKLVSCMEELLVAGNTVSLGNIGTFRVNIKCKPSDSYEDFNAGTNIKKVYPIWKKGPVFKNLKESKLGMSFERVLTKKEDAAAKEAVYGA